MNVSPHHQHPTKYPWPGRASTLAVVTGIAVIALIAFILIFDPFSTDSDERDPAAAGITAAQASR